jgi:hypothetical protein
MEPLWSVLFTVPNPKGFWLETKKILSGKSTAKLASYDGCMCETKESREHRVVLYSSGSLWPLKVVRKRT